jgi:DNA repair photolyase
VPALRVVAVRVNEGQLDWLPDDQSARRHALPILDERLRGTKFVALENRSILNAPQQTGMDFWSLNPYIGCEFGCSYCYARYTHRYAVERAHEAGKLSDAEFADFRGAHGWEAFERRVFVKAHTLAALERDLRRVRPGETIVIGTATDPYQPAERQFRITRGVLERLASCEGLSFGIITKSPLVARDIDVLRRVAQHNDLEIYVSLITLDAKLIRVVEARSPVPAARLRALKRLTGAGLNAGLIVAPVLPGITDDVPHLEALLRAARAAGAHFVHAGALRLYAGVRDRFLPLLAEHFPQLRERYGRAYARQSAAPAAYATALKKRIQRLQQRCGLPVNHGMVDRYKTRRPAAQLDIGL